MSGEKNSYITTYTNQTNDINNLIQNTHKQICTNIYAQTHKQKLIYTLKHTNLQTA